MRHLLHVILWIANILAGLALLASAFAGGIDPVAHPFAAVVAMALPVTVPAMLAVLVLDVTFSRRATVWALVCICLSLPAALQCFPVHLPPGELSEQERARSFTLLSYNVMDFESPDDSFPAYGNATLSYILAADADVVCLQESSYLCPLGQTNITQAQIDSLHARYPYRVRGPQLRHFTLLSKYPVQPLVLPYRARVTYPDGHTDHDWYWNYLDGYTLTIHGRRVNIFSVHLSSFGLTDADKALYGKLTRLNGGGGNNLSSVRHSLVAKVEVAAIRRAAQVQQLIGIISHHPADRVIVCGDFNDVPASWPLRQLQKRGFHEVYPQLGFGYMPTYNRNRFLFTIDHVLYRGALKPHAILRGRTAASDHFPLLTTFVLED